MRDFFKNKLVTIIIVVATIILAGIAIFTAVRLYQLRQESISPARPESVPAAAEGEYESCGAFVFRISETPPPEVAICDIKEAYRNHRNNAAGNYNDSFTEDLLITDTDTVSPDEIIVYRVVPSPIFVDEGIVITDTLSSEVEFLDAESGCDYDNATRVLTCTGQTYKAYRVTVATGAVGPITNAASVDGVTSPPACQLTLAVSEEETTPTPTPTGSPTATPTTTPTGTPTPTPTATATPTPPATCNDICTTDTDCDSSLTCQEGFCRNPSCTESTNCICEEDTPTPTATPTDAAVVPTPTATSAIAESTPTDAGELPEAGVGTPTLFGIGIGLLLLLISFALAL